MFTDDRSYNTVTQNYTIDTDQNDFKAGDTLRVRETSESNGITKGDIIKVVSVTDTLVEWKGQGGVWLGAFKDRFERVVPPKPKLEAQVGGMVRMTIALFGYQVDDYAPIVGHNHGLVTVPSIVATNAGAERNLYTGEYEVVALAPAPVVKTTTVGDIILDRAALDAVPNDAIIVPLSPSEDKPVVKINDSYFMRYTNEPTLYGVTNWTKTTGLTGKWNEDERGFKVIFLPAA